MATGLVLLILGGTMALITGKGDVTVITAGLIIAFGGTYVLSLVHPATKQFVGTGWTELVCRVSAVIAGLLMTASGFMGAAGCIGDMLAFNDLDWITCMIIGLVMLVFGLRLLKLAVYGVQP